MDNGRFENFVFQLQYDVTIDEFQKRQHFSTPIKNSLMILQNQQEDRKPKSFLEE